MLPKGSIAALLIEEKKKAKGGEPMAEESEGGEEEMGGDDEGAAAGGELASAIKAGDGAGVYAAFQKLVGMCSGGGDASEPA